jgi:hypothetical protein
MSTNFKGVRIRYPETPLITAYDIYMDLIATLDTSGAGTGTFGSGGGKIPGSASPILQTLLDNGASGSNINVGNIKPCPVPEIKGIKFMLNPDKQMLCEAVQPLTEMLKDWADWMSENGFKSIDKKGGEDVYAYITCLYRSNGSNSMHAYGLAVDVQMFNKEGVVFRNGASDGRYSPAEFFNFQKNPALKWLYNHSYEYGFVQPYWANDGKGSGDDSEEHWHWEYHGKSAICMLRKQLIPGRGGNSASDNPASEVKESKIKSFVKNPKGKDGKEANYGTGCDYKASKANSDKSNDINSNASTTTSKADINAAQLKTKNFFKAEGLTKSQVAGIMGNIHHETGGTWNPEALNKEDLNGYSSYGLIQWNQQFTSKEKVGNTVDSQIKYLKTMSTYKTWLNLGDEKGTKKFANSAAYEFARLVEVCDKCNKGYETYKTSYQAPRSQYANDYFRRFDDKKDPLYWG